MVGRGEDVEATIRRLYRDIELAVREGTMLIGHDGTVVGSLKAGPQLGVTDAALIGGPPLPAGWSMFDEQGGALRDEEHPAVIAQQTGVTAERLIAYSNPDEDGVHLRQFIAHPIVDDPEIAVDVVVTDPAHRVRSRAAVENQETRFRTLTDLLPVAIYEATPAGEVTYVNPTFTKLTGHTADSCPDLPMLEIVHPDDLVSVMEAATRAPAEGEYSAQYRVRHLDGSSRWVRSQMALLIDADGKMSGFVGSIEDVDDLRRAEQYANRLADIVESASDAIAIYEDDVLVYLNAAGTSLLERTDPAFASGPRTHTFGAQLLDPFRDEISPALLAGGTWSGELRLADAEGDPVDLSLTVTADADHREGIGRFVVRARDIREQKVREAELTHAARHDPLTGLANRHRLHESIRSNADRRPVAALFIDIDHFKRTNDDHGHATGDGVLIEVARRLTAAVRSTDLVARVGGDEIVVWAPATTTEDAEALAGRLVAAVNGEPMVVGGRSHTVTVTIGVATGDGTGQTELITQADDALYRAKRTGRNRWLRV